MRMARLVAPRKIEVIQTAKPKSIASTEARVRVRYVGICGTDMHIFAGERSDVRLPRVMGHELSGIVLEVGYHRGVLRWYYRYIDYALWRCSVVHTKYDAGGRSGCSAGYRH